MSIDQLVAQEIRIAEQLGALQYAIHARNQGYRLEFTLSILRRSLLP
jgi:hypothetical protein